MKTPKKIVLEMKTENAAFESSVSLETAIILRKLSVMISRQEILAGDEFVLRDTNGLQVGTAKIL